VVAFPSTADLPPVPTLLLAGDHDLITPLAWTQHEASYAAHAEVPRTFRTGDPLRSPPERMG
jgi:hypothetical protein